jgi:hypothetical protein
MSRIPDATRTAIAEARLRNYHAANTLDPSAIDFGDPVERHAAITHRMTFDTSEAAMSMATSAGGQLALADTWAKLTTAERQLWRRRAALALEFALRGSELRSRPEENVA